MNDNIQKLFDGGAHTYHWHNSLGRFGAPSFSHRVFSYRFFFFFFCILISHILIATTHVQSPPKRFGIYRKRKHLLLEANQTENFKTENEKENK